MSEPDAARCPRHRAVPCSPPLGAVFRDEVSALSVVGIAPAIAGALLASRKEASR